MLSTDCKKIYNILRQKNAAVENTPNKEETEILQK
jgi:hypothetical protein